MTTPKKAALLALLGASFVTAGAWAAEPAFIAAKSSELNWVPAPSVGPGAMLAVIEGDPKTGDPFTMRLKLPANTRIGVHTHPVTERVTVISGTFYFATGDTFDDTQAAAYQAGDMLVIPAGMPMFAGTKEGEAELQLHGAGPWGISYLDPADDPRKQ
ncbi:cupin [Pseudomonas sp. PIC25]|uniref:cupin domain-containing protein n=1 Tax=Pseudomonas sp. PIC25 TaxID=1958773 RepID=UPI000BABA11F|nr:cupin domain-containing protein [Pseudomonas sp. PIC25]PAU63891.1 cupin [Pseudomonas sp. PIC25]